jgi:hypothetical protein
VADYNGNNNKKADSSDKECITAARCSVKRQVWLPTDHFERLLEEACLNHVYPDKHKLKYCSMMKNFMTLGSLTQDKEPEEDTGESGKTPFPGEDAVTTVYDGHPPPGRRRVSNLTPETPTRLGRVTM